jgi:CheY-like chemotaxis protein
MTPELLLPHLPNLRRYARLLTGKQPAGDALVEQALQRLLDGRIPALGSVRGTLYRALLCVLTERRDGEAKTPSPGGIIDQRLMALNLLAREVFLLITVEQFSLSEAAEVLAMTPADVALHLEDAGDEIARQMATDVLIIEDEPLIALTIENIILDMGHAVSGIAHTKDEALALVKKKKPGLILADIQLADGSSGLEAVREILATRATPAIFITAFPERVLTGTKPEPVFLIAKPFQSAQVRAIVSQTLFFQS